MGIDAVIVVEVPTKPTENPNLLSGHGNFAKRSGPNTLVEKGEE